MYKENYKIYKMKYYGEEFEIENRSVASKEQLSSTCRVYWGFQILCFEIRNGINKMRVIAASRLGSPSITVSICLSRNLLKNRKASLPFFCAYHNLNYLHIAANWNQGSISFSLQELQIRLLV